MGSLPLSPLFGVLFGLLDLCGMHRLDGRILLRRIPPLRRCLGGSFSRSLLFLLARCQLACYAGVKCGARGSTYLIAVRFLPLRRSHREGFVFLELIPSSDRHYDDGVDREMTRTRFDGVDREMTRTRFDGGGIKNNRRTRFRWRAVFRSG